MNSYSIRSAEDLLELATDLSNVFSALPKEFNSTFKISIFVSEEIFDKVWKYFWNRHMLYIDLSHYSEMSITLENIRFQLIIK